MNAENTTPNDQQQPEGTEAAEGNGESPSFQIVLELRATTDSVRGGSWLSGEISEASAGADAPDTSSSPLAPLAQAGFIAEPLSFLEEPLDQLRGDPGALSSSAQCFQDAGQAVASTAESYQQSTGPETSSWSGEAAAGYLRTGKDLVDGLTGLGEASVALAEAATGAGEVVTTTLNELTVLVDEAVGKITVILNQALAAAQATFGASVAAAIPQALQVGAEYGARIIAKMQILLSSAQNLLQHVDSTSRAVGSLTSAITQISERCQQAGTKEPDVLAKQQRRAGEEDPLTAPSTAAARA